MPCSGVRISWLMLARKRLLASVAASGRLHGLLELGVEALEILGLGAFFQFGGQPLGTFLNLAPELEIPENDQQQDGQDDFNAEQAGPECARGKVERRLAAEPAGC